MQRYGRMIDRAASEHNLDSALIAAVIQTESSGDPRAVSKAGAKGLMQLRDGTAREMGVKNSLDPEANIRGGSRYLRRMLDRFGDLSLALAAYNAGPGTVERHGGVPPFKETRDYIVRVTRRMAVHATRGPDSASKEATDRADKMNTGSQP
jgi:soluble lytic murein transglycosylase-like protein